METNIKAKVRDLVLDHGTRDPYIIAKDLGINVVYKPYSRNTKGYFINILESPFIVVNEILDEAESRVIMAHELGHALLHSAENIYFIREYTLFPVGPLEIEANQFASELLIDCDDIDRCMFKGWNSEQISSYLNVFEEMVEYKLKG